jgi:hypothetical protein
LRIRSRRTAARPLLNSADFQRVKDGIISGIKGINEIETQMVSLVRNTVKEGAAVGADLGQVARRTLDGVMEAARETGSNVEEFAKVTVNGAVDAAGSIGNNAVKTVSEVLTNAVEGIKGIAGAALPKTKDKE